MRFLLLAILIPFVSRSQTITDTTFSTWRARVFLPANWDGNADSSRQCIVYSYGAGQVSPDGHDSLSLYGPLAYIAGGWNGGVVLGNGTHYPVIIGLQQNTAYVLNGEVVSRLNAIRARYKIKVGNLHVMGYSAGGHTYKMAATEDAVDDVAPYGPFTYASAFKSIVDLHGVVPDDNSQWFIKAKNFARNGVTGGGKYLGIYGLDNNVLSDRQIPRFKDSMNAAVPGSAQATYFADNHVPSDVPNGRIFGKLDGTAPQSFSIFGVTQNVYQWALRQGDTASANIPPTVSASGSSSIKLPTSTVTVSSTSSDADGSISSTTWSQTQGPVSASISTPTLSSTNITFTQQGTYVFSVTVTDNSGASSSSSVTIIVNPAKPEIFYRWSRKVL